MIYLIPLLFIIFSIVCYDIANYKRHKKLIFITIIFILWAISALSYRIGIDVANNYMPEFHTIKTLDNISYDYLFDTHNRQFGWMLLLTIIKSITPSFTLFKAIHALIINFTFGYVIYKYFKLKFTALLCYYVFIYVTVNFEILRESLAASFFLLSIPYFIKRKFFKYYLFICISISFHMSAFILLLFPLSILITKSRNLILCILCICIASLAFVSQTQQLFYNLIFIESLSEKAIHYFSSETHGASSYSIGNLVNYILNIIAPILLILKVKENDKYINQFAPYIIVYAIIYTASTHISIFFRFNNYFNIFFIFAYIELFYSKLLFSKYSQKQRNKILFMAIIVFCILKLNVIMKPINNIPGYYRYYPYSSIFDKERNVNREKIFDYLAL